MQFEHDGGFADASFGSESEGVILEECPELCDELIAADDVC